MRIRLKKGKQKELILNAKGKMFWPEFAKRLGLNSEYLRNEMKNEVISLQEQIYMKMCNITNANYDKYIIGRYNDNWGQIKGGKISLGKTKKISIPKDTKELAEFYGIMLGDGNITKVHSYKIGTYQLRIVGDKRYDKEYITYFVKNLVEKLFDIKSYITIYPNENTITLTFHSKALVDFMASKGFNAGDKIKNKLTIPNWISTNPELLKPCIRGLLDTDGSIYKLTNQNVYQICFVSHNILLLNDVRKFIINLNIIPSKIVNNRKFYITKKSELRKFLKDIGFNNPRHLNKIKMWKL